MKIEHFNLFVKDIEQALTFYQAAFPHWKVRGGGSRPWYGKETAWIHFGDEETYIAFNDGGEGENRKLDGSLIGLAHFAFVVDNLQSLIKRLEDAGFSMSHTGADEPYRKNCYFIDVDGFEVEFVEYLSDLPAERNLYR